MVWSKLDFEREVRRQLVELESIRKRLPANSEVRQKIDKLEASHMNLLRKLAEIFPKPKTSKRAQKTSRALERYMRTVEQTAKLKALAIGGRQCIGTIATPKTREETALRELPSLDAKCATCGRILLSSLLGGEEVVLSGDAWHHRDCTGDGEGFGKPGMLN